MDLPQVRLSGKLNLHPVGNPGIRGSHGGDILLRWSGQTIRIGQVRHRADRADRLAVRMWITRSPRPWDQLRQALQQAGIPYWVVK